MNASIWQTIAETSFWVYILYAMIIYIGYQHSKQRAIPTLVLWTSMIAFTCASIIGMSFFVKFSIVNIAWWGGLFLLGASFGWLHYYRLQVQHLADEEKLLIPGSWITMTAISGVMAAKYYFGPEISMDPDILKTGAYSPLLMALYGFITGLYIGRILYARRIIRQTA